MGTLFIAVWLIYVVGLFALQRSCGKDGKFYNTILKEYVRYQVWQWTGVITK